MIIYLAGPDVFFANVEERLARLEAQCRLLGFTPIRPVDGAQLPSEEAAQAIFDGNMSRIRSCDAVLANLCPFRGPVEPDSGTVFELGAACALGKLVVGYGVDPRVPLRARIETELGLAAGPDGLWDANCGARVEDFGLPLNLMLGVSVPCFPTSLEALEALALRRRQVGAAGG